MGNGRPLPHRPARPARPNQAQDVLFPETLLMRAHVSLHFREKGLMGLIRPIYSKRIRRFLAKSMGLQWA
jgi:hypothetical protein